MGYSGKNFPGSNPTFDKDYEVYGNVPVKGIDYDNFILTSDGLSADVREQALGQLREYEAAQKSHFLGYQANQSGKYDGLSEYLDMHVNNIGDPFVSGNFTTNSKFAERAVLDYFASLWHAKWPCEAHFSDGEKSKDWQDSYWGYALSMGSSEGNIYGMWSARDYLEGKKLTVDDSGTGRAPRLQSVKPRANAANVNSYTPIAFYSQDTHYSIIKNTRILAVTNFHEEALAKKYKCPLSYPSDYPDGYSEHYIENGWPTEVPSDLDGNVYLPALEKLVDFFAKEGYPPLIVFNYGTTFKGTYDDVAKGVAAIIDILKKYGLDERTVEYEDGKTDLRNGFWIHIDSALGAAYAPYLKKLDEFKDLPVFDFSIDGVHSLTMSGHKWIGAPWPCGIFLTKLKYQLYPVDDPAYIGSPDTTFAGSRNGFSALILWDFISKNSVEDLIARIEKGLTLTDYAITKLEEVQAFRAKAYGEPADGLWIEHSKYALTVRLRKANDDITFKYSLSGEELYVKDKVKPLKYSHIYLMDHVTKELLDEFAEDLKAEDAFAPQDAVSAVVGRGRGFR
ncbi:hypothetical protein AGMMS49975_20960 [Clostridia bacterium]|nr:hypothetical protein AGMMS49975_20960 [Clostridia bacterium]